MAARQEAGCAAARGAAKQMAKEQALGVALVAIECEAGARAVAAGVWFRVEPGEVEHTIGPVWVGRVSPQVGWGGKAGGPGEWLAVHGDYNAGRGGAGLGDSG